MIGTKLAQLRDHESHRSGGISTKSGGLMKLLVIAALLYTAPLFAATPCEDLAKQSVPNATITTAQAVAAGSFQPPEGSAIPVSTAFCRVSLVLQPSSDSDIRLEVWLPISGWNGKFQGIGNGGFAGSV